MKIEKTSKMLDEDRFWEIVHRSRSKSQDAQEQNLIAAIEKLTPSEMIGFRLRTDQLLHQTYTPELWCAAYIMNGGCSDDGFEYFRNWIISLGREVYYAAMDEPDSLVAQASNQDFYEFESFWYVALEAFENKTNKELYDFIAADFDLNEGNYAPIKFNWEDDKPETMKALCPKLFEKFWPEK